MELVVVLDAIFRREIPSTLFGAKKAFSFPLPRGFSILLLAESRLRA